VQMEGQRVQRESMLLHIGYTVRPEVQSGGGTLLTNSNVQVVCMVNIQVQLPPCSTLHTRTMPTCAVFPEKMQFDKVTVP
jgi:hypothetical protein